MADVSKDVYRGLLIPDDRIKNANLDLVNSTFNQAGPQPGVADDTSTVNSELVINTGGTQGADGKLRLRTLKGGYPSKLESGATCVWYDENAVAMLVIQDVRYDAVTSGPGGNDITIEYTTGATAGAEVITVTGNAIVVQIESGVSTSSQIVSAVNGDSDASALVTAVDLNVSSSPTQTGAVAASALATQWRGYIDPYLTTGWDWIEFDDDGTTAPNINYKSPDVITLADDTVVCCYHGDDGTTPFNQDVYIKTYDPDTSTWTAGATITTDIASSAPLAINPTLLQLPSGRILLFHWFPKSSSFTNIKMWYSDDSGATFTLGSKGVLNNNIDTGTITAQGKLRCAYNDGQILLMSSATISGTQRLIQWASADDGNSFVDIDLAPSNLTVKTGLYDIVEADGGGFIVAYTDGIDDLYAIKLDSAYIVFDDQTGVALNTTLNPAEVAAYKTDEGRICVIARGTTSASRGLLTWTSLDDGATWASADESSTVFMVEFGNAAAIHTNDISATICRGMGVVVFKYENSADAVTPLNSLGVLYTGGSSTVTNPPQILVSPASSLEWELAWIGCVEPSDVAWSGSAGGTVTHTPDGLHINTLTTANTYTTPTGFFGSTATNGLIAQFELIVTSSTAVSNDGVYLRQYLDDTTDRWGVDYFFDSDQFHIKNLQGTELARVTLDTTSGVEIISAMDTDGVNAATLAWWYRVQGSNTNKEWKLGQPLSVAKDTGNGGAWNTIEFGHNTSGDSISVWKKVLTSRLSLTSEDISNGQTNPDDLSARHFSSTTTSLNGVTINPVNGPTYGGETWSIDTRYDYGIENLDHNIQPSPQIPWRSTGEGAESIIWKINDNLKRARMGNKTVALALLNSNIIGFTLSGLKPDGTWGSIESSLDVRYLWADIRRDADTLYFDTTSNNGQWFDYNEWAGSYVQLDYSGTPAARQIRKNTDGYVTGSTSKNPTVFFDGYTETEPASDLPTALVPNNVLIIMKNVQNYAGFKLDITANTGNTVNGYHEIGNIVLGTVEYFGTQYSHGREIELQTNTEVTTRKDGTRYSRNLGKARRKVAFSWDEGVDTSQTMNTGSVVPDYILPYDAGEAVGVRASTPTHMRGIIEQLDGPDKVVVYVPRIEYGTATDVQRHKRDMVYGRIVSTVSTAAVLGDENDDEVLRISTVEIEEEI